MAMLGDCLAFQVKAGKVSQEAVDDFLKRLADAEKRAQQQGMSGVNAYLHAATTTAVDMVDRARTRRAEVVRQILSVDRVWEASAKHSGGRFLGLINALGENLRGVANNDLSVAQRSRAVYAVLGSFNADFVERARSKMAGLSRDVAEPQHVVRELYGEGTASKTAATHAKAWSESVDYALDLLRAAGVKVGSLEDWRLPQRFDPLAVSRLGKDSFVSLMEGWWRDGRLRLRDWEADGTAYLVQGTRESENRVRDIMNRAYDNITTDAGSAGEPGVFRRSTLSDRYGRRRAFEWADADAWIDFNRRLGVGDDGIFDLMVGHLRHIANDIALAQVLGPDPAAAARTLITMFGKERQSAWRRRFLENIFEQSSGRASTPVGEHFAVLAQGFRNWLAASQLGGAVLSAVTDFGFTRSTAAWNNLSMTRIGAEYLKGLNPANAEHRLRAARSGLILDVGLRTLSDGARDTMADAASRLPGRVAEVVMRAQGLMIHTQAMRDAFGLEMQGHFADLAKTAFAKLPVKERRTLATYGITPADWDILRSKGVVSVDPDVAPFLDPARLARESKGAEREAALKFIAAIAAEQRYAVPEGNSISRAILLGQSQPGTLGGEFRRSVAQYKSFPVAVLLHHGGRALDNIANPDGSWLKGSYLAGLMVTMTSLGALSLNLKNLAQGKDAEDASPLPLASAIVNGQWSREADHAARFWGRALAQGGGAGILGDFLQNAVSGRSGRDLTATLAGPGLGAVGDITNLVLGNPGQFYRDEKMNLGREAVRTANRYTPDVWYTRLAMDRLVWDSLQKMADPDYHDVWRRMKDRARKDQDVGFWWGPGETAPTRAPRLPMLEAR